MKSFWAGLFSPPRDRFSLEELQHLHAVLLRNEVVSDANRDVVVETLRSIAELVIWGDQHDPSMVEYFLTENMLGHFRQILSHRANRRGEVAMQVLQTLSILIQNVRTQQTVYYLFSNDHINEVAALRFDFEDDEVLGYYVNLLKTISLRLNESTVQFFFHQDPVTAASAFPLYTEACKFIAHRDGMVRAAVKTLTLNVYSIPLPTLRAFLCAGPAARFFDQLAAYVAERCTALDRLLSSWDAAAPQASAAVESCLAEVEDLLSYCNDVLASRVAPLSALLLGHLWRQVVGPVLFWPLVQEDVGADIAALASAGGAEAAGVAGGSGSGLQGGVVGALCSLYVFDRLFHAVTDAGLLSVLAATLLGGPVQEAAASLTAALVQLPQWQPAGSPGDGRAPRGADSLLAELRHTPAAFRSSFVAMLRGGDAQLAAAAVRVLAALLGSRSLPEGTLEAVGLLPRRRRKQRELLEELTRETCTPAVAADVEPPSLPNSSEQIRVFRVSELAVEPGSISAPAASPAAQPQLYVDAVQPLVGSSSSEAELVAPTLDVAFRPGRYSPRQEQWPRSAGGRDAAPTALGETHFDEIVSALFSLLGQDLTPPLALCTAGWTLQKVLAAGAGGAEMAPAWQAAVAAAAEGRRQAARSLLRGPWCDALLPLAGLAWGRTRAAVLRTGAGPLHSAAHTWAQAALVQDLHWQLGGAAEQVAAANATVAIKLAWVSMQALVAVLQIQQILETGGVVAEPPVPAPSAAEVAAHEVAEGSKLSVPSVALPCAVAFARGEERQVLLGVAGLPPHIKAGGAAAEQLSRLKPEALAAVAAAAPAAVVVHPWLPVGEGRQRAGVVLSVAPLMGASAAVDDSNPLWLHVEVRPQLSAVLRMMAAAAPGAELLTLGRQLSSGHWVLDFAAEGAAAAVAALSESQQAVRAACAQLLAPLLGESPSEQQLLRTVHSHPLGEEHSSEG